MCIYIYIHTDMHIYIYIYTHTYMHMLLEMLSGGGTLAPSRHGAEHIRVHPRFGAPIPRSIRSYDPTRSCDRSSSSGNAILYLAHESIARHYTTHRLFNTCAYARTHLGDKQMASLRPCPCPCPRLRRCLRICICAPVLNQCW